MEKIKHCGDCDLFKKRFKVPASQEQSLLDGLFGKRQVIMGFRHCPSLADGGLSLGRTTDYCVVPQEFQKLRHRAVVDPY